MAEEIWRFHWSGIRGEVSALGGMLGPVWFTLPNGKEVQPFAVAPWSADSSEQLERLPPVLRRLRGEWPCVPFGVPGTRTDLPERWLRDVHPVGDDVDEEIHGYSSNHFWRLSAQDEDGIELTIDYPPAHPIRKLVRRISRRGDFALEISLEIDARQTVDLPIGLHPVFALPEHPGLAELKIPSLKCARTFPVPVERNSVFSPDQHVTDLRKVATRDGQTLNLCQLPLLQETEELISLLLTEGEVVLSNAEAGYAVALRWDVKVLPRCLLWISNYGRDGYPWNGRFRAIGIEPVASAFDLGIVHSRNTASPLAEEGVQTSVLLSPETPFRTSYSVEVSAI